VREERHSESTSLPDKFGKGGDHEKTVGFRIIAQSAPIKKTTFMVVFLLACFGMVRTQFGIEVHIGDNQYALRLQRAFKRAVHRLEFLKHLDC